MKKFLTLLTLLLAVSCNDEEPLFNEALSNQLVGKWESLSLEIKMPTYQGKKETKTFVIKPGEWEKIMNARAVTTVFKNDGSYSSLHYSLKDSLILNPAGWWMIKGDTVYLRDTFPERGPVYKYQVKFVENTVRFSGQEDSDNDGVADDTYTGVSLRK